MTYTVMLPNNQEIAINPNSVDSLSWAIAQVRPFLSHMNAKYDFFAGMCALSERLHDQRRCAEVAADEDFL